MVPYLQIDGLTKSFGDLVLFNQISLGVAEGQRIGLIAKNGSGKTTLLNVIAQKLNLHRSTLYNRSSFFDDYLKFCDSFLGRNEKSQLAIQKGCIITSDDVFDNILKKREENQNIDHQRSLLVEQYFGRTAKKKKDPTCS